LDENTIYSCKVFLGGLPSDLTDECIIHRLLPFGQVEIERLAGSRVDTKNFAYAIFDREEAVSHLVIQIQTKSSLMNKGKGCYTLSVLSHGS